jgi:hypothetical protein
MDESDSQVSQRKECDVKMGASLFLMLEKLCKWFCGEVRWHNRSKQWWEVIRNDVIIVVLTRENHLIRYQWVILVRSQQSLPSIFCSFLDPVLVTCCGQSCETWKDLMLTLQSIPSKAWHKIFFFPPSGYRTFSNKPNTEAANILMIYILL